MLAALVIAAPARAEPVFEGPIVDNAYSIDFSDGVAIGSTAQVGMGGAGSALIVGTAGVLLNPSAIAVRNTTDTDWWGWDYHLDVLTGKYSSDYDNNGSVPIGASGDGPTLVTAGAGGRLHDWAIAVTFSAQTAPIADSLGTLSAEAFRTKFVLAKFVPQLDVALGVGIQSVTFEVVTASSGRVFGVSGQGLEAGATWIPRLRDFRIGAAVEAAIDGGTVDTTCTDRLDCDGYKIPNSVKSAGRVVLGGAYRLSETAWNQLVGGVFRDEPSLTLAADLVVTGASADGYGIEAFGMNQLQRSGRHIAVSARAGAEYEWVPGRLRLRAGSYWEPQRFDGVSGRLHGTFGAEVRVFEFELWGRRRGRLGFTADVASAYRNVAFSIGFWH